MRSSTLATLLLSSMASAAFHPVFNNHYDARHIQIANPAASPRSPSEAMITPDPLRNREVIQGPAAAVPTGGISQVPSITTQWMPTVLNGVTTVVEVVYTQQFAEVPSQGAAAGVGNIGLGSIKGEVGAVRTEVPQHAGAASTVMVGGWRAIVGLGAAVGVGAGLVLF